MSLPSSELISRRSELGRGLVADRSADTAVAALGLRRMRALMERLGNPQDRYPAIHIAGSKGKGTTAYISGALLTGHGHRTGRYTSPHLHGWHERIAIDSQSLPEADFARVLAHVDAEMSRLEREQPELGRCNAFELLTAAAFVHFAESAVDFAVVEVGLGGRFDSTNVVHAAATVITRIEREHEDILGPSLREIAWNKAGIVSSAAPVIVTRQGSVVVAVIEAEAAANSAPLMLEDRDWSVDETERGLTVRAGNFRLESIPAVLPGEHNRSNLAAAVLATSCAMSDRPLDPAAVRRSLAELRIPGRFERLTVGAPPVEWVLDVAHTRESILALVETAAWDPALQSLTLMLALLSDKPAEDILGVIAGRIAHLILPELHHPRAIPAQELSDIALRLGIPTRIAPDVTAAVEIARTNGRPVLVTGSFTIVAQTGAAMNAAACHARNQRPRPPV